ncbi:glutamate receptor 2.7-like [Bidens hawaiensis]|uniref:glutamate receptor 2.7-like n=1 Tax=Bidens hawaiensis TaxID=980011 RepID=UPI00404A9C85
MPSNAKKMKIAVPVASSFKKFVKVEQIEDSKETKYWGFCIELVVAILEKDYNYTLPYEFISHTGTNADMVDQVYYKKYDAAVGDIAILANRSRYVKFTRPFIESEFSMVVPMKSDMQKHQVNREFRGPWNHQLGTALLFTLSCLFFSHRKNIQSNHSKVVVMIWLFFVFIISSSYTASLTSTLTVRSLEPTIRDIDWLRKTNASVGCDPNSFVCKYLKDALNLTNIKNVSREEKCRDHFTNGTISAAFLELSYQRYFFKEHCDEYMVVGPTLNNGGLGFIFPQDSPITDDVSRAILTLLEDGTIGKLEIEWLKADKSCLSSNPELEGERLGLANFWGLFLISGLTSTQSLGVFIYRLNHNQIKRIVSFNGRWRKAARVVKIALNFKRNKVKPEEKMEPANKWDQQSPPEDNMEPSNKWDDQQSPQRWERVSPTEVPENVEIGRPTQLEIPMRKMDSGKY